MRTTSPEPDGTMERIEQQQGGLEISYSGRRTRRDLLRALTLHLRPTQGLIIVRAVLALFVTLGYLLLLVTLPQLGLTVWSILLGWALPVVLLLSFWWLPNLVGLLRGRDDPTVEQVHSGRVVAEGICEETPQESGCQTWATYSHRKIGPGDVLLYRTDATFQMYERSLFQSEADWEAFVDLVTAHVPPAKPSLWSWLLIVLGVLLSFGTLVAAILDASLQDAFVRALPPHVEPETFLGILCG